MWSAAASGWRRGARRLSSAVRRRLDDEGDWAYSPEWWGAASDGHSVFRSVSHSGNGVVSVLAYPASRPAPEQWPMMERWLQQRYAEIHPAFEHEGQFKILGYQWRVLRFNDNTRQSTAKIMAACRKSDPHSLYLMQQPHCLAVPYLKSMLSAGLAALASFNYDLPGAIMGKRIMNILCIGHGGGSLPLFLATKIEGANVHIVEIDPVVITASTQAMGFPVSAVREASNRSSFSQPSDADQILWKEVFNRLFLCRSDAEDFVLNSRDVYDLVFIDAYDGDDIFPRKLWDSEGAFLKALRSRINPVHGTVVVNLHSDLEENSVFESLLPMGKYVQQVCKAYKDHLGMAFTVSVPWLCNRTLVACNGEGFGGPGTSVNRDLVLTTLVSKSHWVESVLDLPFPCLQYIQGGFVLVA